MNQLDIIFAFKSILSNKTFLRGGGCLQKVLALSNIFYNQGCCLLSYLPDFFFAFFSAPLSETRFVINFCSSLYTATISFARSAASIL